MKSDPISLAAVPRAATADLMCAPLGAALLCLPPGATPETPQSSRGGTSG